MTFKLIYRGGTASGQFMTNRISFPFVSLAIYVLILFPVLPLTAGANGFLTQSTFAFIIILPILLRRSLPPPLPRYWLILLIYFVIVAFAMALRKSSNDTEDYATLLRFAMPLAAVVAGFSLAGRPVKFLRNLIIFSSISLISIHALVILGEYSAANIWYFRDSSELGQKRAFYHIFRAAGFFGYPSEAAIILSVLVLLYVGRVGEWSMRTLSIIALVFVAVLATQSRAGLGVLSLALLCLLLYLPGRRKLLLVFLGAIFIMSNLSLTYLEGSMANDISDTNLFIRFQELNFLYQAIFQGMSMEYGVDEYRNYFGTLESNYLTLYLRGGLIAVLAEAVLMIIIGILIAATPVGTAGQRAIRTFAAILFLANAIVINLLSGIAVQGKAAVFVWMLWGFTGYFGQRRSITNQASL